MGEDEIVRLFNAKIKLERKQYKEASITVSPREDLPEGVSDQLPGEYCRDFAGKER